MLKPEPVDTIFKVGSFAPTAGVPNQRSLSVNTAPRRSRRTAFNFDLDLIVVTLNGQSPTASVVAMGARTLFEKRFFRERAGSPLDPVTPWTSSALRR